MRLRNLLLFAVPVIFIVAPSAGDAGELRVKISGIESAEGEVRVAIFKSQEDFDSTTFAYRTRVPAQIGAVEVVFEDVAPGTYGINAFHDANNNEELDRNLVGLPLEDYGFSNNARGRFGPPKFDDISFAMSGKLKAMEIELK